VAILFNIAPSSYVWKLKLPDEHDRAISEVIALIPEGTTVTAANQIFPHLCDTTEVYMPHWYGRASIYDDDIVWGYPERLTEYVVVDWTESNIVPEGAWEKIIEDQIDEDYDSMIKIDDVELFKLRGN
jgi:hypothetical protein